MIKTKLIKVITIIVIMIITKLIIVIKTIVIMTIILLLVIIASEFDDSNDNHILKNIQKSDQVKTMIIIIMLVTTIT